MFKSPTRNSFLYQYSALNIFFVALLIAAVFQGWVGIVWAADISHIIAVIAATFVGSLVVSIYKAVELNNMWNLLTGRHSRIMDFIRGKKAESLGLWMSSKIQIVHHLAVVMLLMGIGGTMIGIIMALKSTETFVIGDQANMVAAILMLFKGVYVKFYASLVGIIGHTWLLTNYNMLTAMSRRLLARMVDNA